MRDKTQVSPLKENKMGVMPTGKLLFNMALPMIIAMVVQALYNIVDSIYVSRISESAVTALSLAYPIQNIQIGFAVGIGVGVNSLLSKALGGEDRDTADKAAGNGMFLALIVMAGFMLFGIFGARPYFEMQSDVAQTVNSGTTYVAICCILTQGIFVEVLGERLLQSSGRTFYTMITQGTGAVLNILLDPLFIFGFKPLGIPAMGIAGAAVATVIGQWVAGALAVYFNFRRNEDIDFTLESIRPHWQVLKPILTVGIPSIIMMAIGSIMTFGMNQIFQSFQETATGVFGIYFKLQSFFFMPVFGINNATVSIIAYNYGARNPERIMDTLKKSCLSAMAIMVAGFLVFQIFTDQLLGVFQPSADFLIMGRKALRIISIIFPMAAIGIAVSGCFQALGNGIYSTIVSTCRQLVALLPVAYLLSLTGDVNLVWWAFPISEVLSLVVTLVLFARIYRQKIKPLYAAVKS